MVPDVTHDYDVVIVGGGPAGATLGTFVARAGHRVALFERRSFPRFHVGESLVPAVNLTLEKLGVLDQMDGRGFPRKHGVQFFSPKGAGRPFYFSEVDDPRMHSTWQVLRSDFDSMLLDNAAKAGVTVSTESEVLEASTDNGSIECLRLRQPDGTEKNVRARIVVDASGQRSLIARRFGGHTTIEGLSNASVFAHFNDADRDTGIDAGSTLIFRIDAHKWLWSIPLPGAVSIGLVASARDIWSMGGTPNEVLDTAIAECEPLRQRLTRAHRATDVLAVRDYTYRANQDGGKGWMLVGDALGFIDPMYSTGLFLTMLSAELAADAIDVGLATSEPQPDLAGYSTRYQAAFDRFLILVRAFYSEGFRFGEFAKNDEYRKGLVDLLTGIVDSPAAHEVSRALASTLHDDDAMTR